MRAVIILLFAGLAGMLRLHAQDPVISINPGQFNRINEILISEMDGWQFMPGHDTARAGNHVSSDGWRRMKLTDLSPEMADKDGRLEGWLRFQFILDPSFSEIPLGLRYSGWAALDVYLDGILFQSYGSTGLQNKPFREYNPSNRLPAKLSLTTGVTHTLTLHLVDYVSPFLPHRLKSANPGLDHFIRFTGPDYYRRFVKHLVDWPVFSTLWISVCTILSLLFWLLAFLNRREHNLFWFAICSTLFTAIYIFKTLSENSNINYTSYRIYLYGFSLFAVLSSSVTVIIVAKIFKNKVSAWLKLFLVAYLGLAIIGSLLQSWLISGFGTLLPLLIYAWYILSSWKSLRGAQWVIVAGLLVNLSLTFYWVWLVISYKSEFVPNNMMILSGMILSFPVALMVYVALRFKEIIADVRLQAAQVLKLSEEKKEQAEKQQKILEEEVARQTVELRTSLENLKAAQSQLVQSEKMASLGELTAGIAHEIQNPLNFVNNFSELNRELAGELKQELATGNWQSAKEIADNIIANEEKINHHGRRADSIVKGMLQHSRSSSGQKEPTDINALCDEYLRLAYHGLRAKDKSFNAVMKTEFDESIGTVSVISQDLGRVILNLITNAFYAVSEKRKLNIAGYQPTVVVTTKRLISPEGGPKGAVEIKVKDNGMGIPKKVLDKIFQPFFTTKPTGEGTGLGLSLSYDIITKGHGGELKADTKEGEFAEFIIILPS